MSAQLVMLWHLVAVDVRDVVVDDGMVANDVLRDHADIHKASR